MNTINDVHKLNSKGPWQTKSNANLDVLFGYDMNYISNFFFDYSESEMQQLPKDIRGMRSYIVSKIPINSIGANEWHKIRNELAITIEGVVEWELTDKDGKSITITVEKNEGIYIPNHILHKYKSLKLDSAILVLANTIFEPDDPQTHDTYTKESF